ncbi:MAG: synthase subunit [Enterovirga sp.]|nr:synthase subunit [Enterovirga sp.]
MTQDQRPAGGEAPDRLRELQARIDRAKASGAEAGRPNASTTPPSGLSAALRLSTELFAGVAVGGGMGWFLDRALGSSPFGLIVFILIGFAAGTVNLIRSAGRGSRPPKPTEPASGA